MTELMRRIDNNFIDALQEWRAAGAEHTINEVARGVASMLALRQREQNFSLTDIAGLRVGPEGLILQHTDPVPFTHMVTEAAAHLEYGAVPPHIICRDEGMAAGAAALAAEAEPLNADLVIATRVRGATIEEVTTAIPLAYDLLRPGGWLAIADYVKDVQPGEASVREMLTLAHERFGQPFAGELSQLEEHAGLLHVSAVFRRPE